MRPDVVVILTDQERAAPPYEGPALARWRERVLVGRQWFAAHGVRFERHYTGSLACVPSRPTLLTGQYPDVHGVTQTDGMAKLADDPRMRWLRPGEVPTLGHWFRAGGYDTHYDGKWHLSHADLIDDDTGAPLATNTAAGEVRPAAVQAYLDADPLAPFGFSGWVGPEPHGPRAADAGRCRHPLIAARVVAWLEDRYARRRAGDPAAARPFLLIASFVNPHDIVFFPAWAWRPRDRGPDAPPAVPPAPTEDDDLATRPAAQAAYRAAYARAYGPGFAVRRIYRWRAAAYRALYYQLHAEVDGPLDRVRRAATAGSPHAVLVHTADHGDLLGAHGGQHQKWGSLYDEATRVPFTIAGLGDAAVRPRRITAMPTSHVDLVPTLLAAAGLDVAALAPALAAAFTELHPLPGRDLTPLLRGAAPDPARAVYLMTRDDVLEGASPTALMWRRAGVALTLPPRIRTSPGVGSSFEAIVVRVADDAVAGGGGHLWKLVRSFDDPATWRAPGVAQRGPGAAARTRPLPDAWELYDLDADPGEADNRAAPDDPVFAHLRARLDAERARAVPARHQPWPYAPEQPPTITARRARLVTADPAQVWATLADLGAIASWAPNLGASARIGTGAPGVGAARHVRVGPLRLIEHVTRWEPGVELAYRIEGLPPVVRTIVNAWRLARAPGGTRVTLTTTIAPRAWPGGRIVAELLARQLARTSGQLLAGLAAHHRPADAQ